MDKKKNEIILFENQGVKLEVNVKDETVWLTQEQMSKLFGKAKSTINEHIKNIYKEEELTENETMTKFGNSEFSDKPTNYYNLDMIISVGYRVKSQQGITFRKWATKILKDYMLKGYAINQKRLDYLEKTVKLIDIANRMDERLEAGDAKEILKVIGEYSKALDLLDDYDHRTLKKINGNIDNRKIEYKECLNIINKLRFNEESSIFAVERDRGLEAIIGNIYQSFARRRHL
jgi:phosphoribosylaminoimidazolesuccinocarboxamide synthase